MRIFISHSSRDKTRYCNEVVDKIIEKLGKDSVVYDALTFEAGEKSIDEINRTLAYSDLYVILLSGFAVDSDWVKYELGEAHRKLEEHTLDRVYPLIIDPKLKYSDDRIPEWLKEYNLKYIARPAKAAKLIIERAKDIKWSRHPAFQYRNTIFVGRNDLVNNFETRIDDFDKPPINTFIISGLPNIGRKSLARHCLVKGTIMPPYYDFPQISLSYQESIEDFIVKIQDLGFTDGDELPKIAAKTFEEKIQYAIQLSKEISKLSEIILIKDDGCLLDYRGNIADWFKEIVLSPELCNQMLFVIITRYKTNFESIRNISSAFFLNVPELNKSERKGLLRRLAQIEQLDLDRNSLEAISQHLTGYPAQIYYAVDLIKHKGYPYLQKRYNLLADYNSQEVSLLLEKYKDNSTVSNILALLSRYDAISINMLYEILSVTPGYDEVYDTLFQESFFELEGVNGEYVRLNEVIRNYIARSDSKILPAHQKKAHELFENIFSNDETPWYNANDFLLAIREQIKQGKYVVADYVIPSVYLKSMSDLYADMKYDDVVNLAHTALEHVDNTDGRIIYETRYLLCSALAKLKSGDFLTEVRALDYDDRTFLLAFYYRQIGKNDRALKYLNELLDKRGDMSKAKREKVLVLKNLQQFEEATVLAKENYYLYSDNPYHIQAYFDCLINTYYKEPEDELLYELLEKLARIQSEKAQSMYARCNSLYAAYVEQDFDGALAEITQACMDFPRDKKYALVVKFDIAQLFNRIDIMEETIKELEIEGSNNNTVIICKSKLLAKQNKVDEAIRFFSANIHYFTEESKQNFCERLQARTI